MWIIRKLMRDTCESGKEQKSEGKVWEENGRERIKERVLNCVHILILYIHKR